MEEKNIPVDQLMVECNCGNPERKGWTHYNKYGYQCAPIEQGETIVTVSQHLNDLVSRRSEPEMEGKFSMGYASGTSDPEKVMEIMKQPQVNVERCGPRHVNLEVLNIPNDQALRVVAKTLPDALELYLQKSRDYGGNVMDRFGLGQKAAIPDIARKFGKLIDAIWNEKPLQFEQVDEVLMDLLGHILIILDQRRDQSTDDLYQTEGL